MDARLESAIILFFAAPKTIARLAQDHCACGIPSSSVEEICDGIRTETVVPDLGAVVISTDPPRSHARSRMPRMPKDADSRPSGMPFPLSWTIKVSDSDSSLSRTLTWVAPA